MARKALIAIALIFAAAAAQAQPRLYLLCGQNEENQLVWVVLEANRPDAPHAASRLIRSYVRKEINVSCTTEERGVIERDPDYRRWFATQNPRTEVHTYQIR